MGDFEALQSIDNFCKVLVKKAVADKSEMCNNREIEPSNEAFLERNLLLNPLETSSGIGYNAQGEPEERLIDVVDEKDHIRILVQCRCREQQVTFHPSEDGLKICREECHKEKGGSERCVNVCQKLNIRTDDLQLEDMLFIIAKCNNNNTLEAMIPKIEK